MFVIVDIYLRNIKISNTQLTCIIGPKIEPKIAIYCKIAFFLLIFGLIFGPNNSCFNKQISIMATRDLLVSYPFNILI